MYLEGAIRVLAHRKTLDFTGLMCGKISFDDLLKPNIAKKLEKEKIKLPPIFENMDEYMGALDVIAATNHIPELGAAETQQPAAQPKANNMTNNENEDDALE